MIGQQRQVQTEREPLGRAQEHHAEEEMDEVLRENQLQGAEAEEREVNSELLAARMADPGSVCHVVKHQELKAELAEPPNKPLQAPEGRRTVWKTTVGSGESDPGGEYERACSGRDCQDRPG